MCKLKQINSDSNEEGNYNRSLFNFFSVCGIGSYNESNTNSEIKHAPGEEKKSSPESIQTESKISIKELETNS
ncbi:MAG: hypothetical protein R6W90_11540 [Ignavibacteriaceae bacterium]